MRRERCRDEDAFDRVGRCAGCQCRRRRDVGLLRHRVPGWSNHRNLVGARCQAGEADIATGIRQRRLPGRDTRAIQQVDGHAGQVWLAAVLCPVGVRVGIDMRVECRERGPLDRSQPLNGVGGSAGGQCNRRQNVGLLRHRVPGWGRY